MLAFSLGWLEIHRYGIFYTISFAATRARLRRFSTRPTGNPQLQFFLKKNLETFLIRTILAVVAGGRLGHVFFYDRAFFSTHPTQIFNLQNGGMAFIGGLLGVTIATLRLARRRHRTRTTTLQLGDLLIFPLTLGIILGRLGNFLNQEIHGTLLADLTPTRNFFFQNLQFLTRNYGSGPAVNINLLAILLEGLLPLAILAIFFLPKILKNAQTPGKILGIFLAIYATARFFLEFRRLDAAPQIPLDRAPLTVSQRFYLPVLAIGLRLIFSKFPPKKSRKK